MKTDKEYAQHLYANGYAIGTIADVLGRDYSWVASIVTRAGRR